MNKYTIAPLIILIMLSFLLSGYYAKQDINDMAYVIALGIDVRRKQ